MHPYSGVQSEGRGKGKSDGGDRVLPKSLWGHSLCPFCSRSIETCGALQLRVTVRMHLLLCALRKESKPCLTSLLSLSAGCPGLGGKERIWPVVRNQLQLPQVSPLSAVTCGQGLTSPSAPYVSRDFGPESQLLLFRFLAGVSRHQSLRRSRAILQNSLVNLSLMLYLQKADPEPGSWSRSRQDVRHGALPGKCHKHTPVKVREDTDAVFNFTSTESQRGGTLAPDTQHGTLPGPCYCQAVCMQGATWESHWSRVLGSLGGVPCTR